MRTERSQPNATADARSQYAVDTLIDLHQLASSHRVGWSSRCQVTSSVRRHVEPHLVDPENRRRLEQLKRIAETSFSPTGGRHRADERPTSRNATLGCVVCIHVLGPTYGRHGDGDGVLTWGRHAADNRKKTYMYGTSSYIDTNIYIYIQTKGI